MSSITPIMVSTLDINYAKDKYKTDFTILELQKMFNSYIDLVKSAVSETLRNIYFRKNP